MNKRKFVVFDVDGTLYRGNLTWELYNELVRNNVVRKKATESLENLFIAHDTRQHENAYSEYDTSLVKLFADSLKSIEYLDLYWALGKRVGIEQAPRLYAYTRNLMKSLKAEGYCLIAITNAVSAIAEPFGKFLGFDYIASNKEQLNEQKTAIIDWSINLPGNDKGQLLKAIIEQLDLDTVGSYAVGDTMADEPLLEMVEHAVTFNPEKQLEQLARKKGWKIVVERKNVTYEIFTGS